MLHSERPVYWVLWWYILNALYIQYCDDVTFWTPCIFSIVMIYSERPVYWVLWCYILNALYIEYCDVTFWTPCILSIVIMLHSEHAVYCVLWWCYILISSFQLMQRADNFWHWQLYAGPLGGGHLFVVDALINILWSEITAARYLYYICKRRVIAGRIICIPAIVMPPGIMTTTVATIISGPMYCLGSFA